MGDSTCVMQSFESKGDPIRALGESVSFGRFMTETLEWEKWSTFNQNRYLEEAQRYSKPGLVAQKKALFEAHFKKIAADRAAALLEASSSVAADGVPSHGVRNENFRGPCMDLESGKSISSSKGTVQNSTNAPLISDLSPASLLLEESGEGNADKNNDSAAEASDFGSANNSDPADVVNIDETSCDMAVDTSQDLELCDKMDSLCDTNKFHHMAVEQSSIKKLDPPDGSKNEIKMLDRPEVADNSAMLLPVPPKKIAIPEPIDQVVLDSTGKCKPTLKMQASVRKPAVPPHSKSRPHALPLKVINATHSSRPLGSAFSNRKRDTTKSLHMSINLESGHKISKRPPVPKRLDITKTPSNSFNLGGSKECPDQLATDTVSHKNLAQTSRTSASIRKSSAELYAMPAPQQIKKDKNIIRRDMASIRNSLGIRKSMPKSVHMSISLGSHVREKERHVSLQGAGAKINVTSARMPETHSTSNAPANQVISDATTTRKQINPVSNTSTDGRNLITHSHAKYTPLYKNKNNGIQRNSALTLSQIDIKKFLPKSLHMSVDLSSSVGVVGKPAIAPKRGSSSINVAAVRASRDSSTQMKMSLKKPNGTSTIPQCDDKSRPDAAKSLIRPPSPTISTPFRFRSDERAARRKEKIEEKFKDQSENFLHGKEKEKEENDARRFRHSNNHPAGTVPGGDDRKKQHVSHKLKFPPSMPQSPMLGQKPSPGNAQEKTNYRPPRTPAKSKVGSLKATENKSSIAVSTTTLLEKVACENASPNIKM